MWKVYAFEAIFSLQDSFHFGVQLNIAYKATHFQDVTPVVFHYSWGFNFSTAVQ